MHSIILSDPTGQYKEGDVLDHVHTRVAESKGAVLLPFSVEYAKRNPVAGFFRRAFGAGAVPSAQAYAFCARGALYLIKSDRTRVHAAFRLVPTGELVRGELRLAADSGQGQINAGSIGINNPVRLTQEVLGEPDVDGGWTVKTAAPLTVAHEGLLMLGLYGNASGVRVEWIAFTQAE